MDELEAIARLKQGDIYGLEYLVRTYQIKALRTAYLIVRDHDLAEDVVQDAFIRAYQRIHQFDGKRPFGPWFFKIVVNLAKRVAVRREREVAIEKVSADSEETALDKFLADLKSPEAIVEQQDLQQMIWRALGRLPPAQRAAIVERYYLGMSEKDIATRADVPLGTIKWRLHTAHKQLRVWLGQLWPNTTFKQVNLRKEINP